MSPSIATVTVLAPNQHAHNPHLMFFFDRDDGSLRDMNGYEANDDEFKPLFEQNQGAVRLRKPFMMTITLPSSVSFDDPRLVHKMDAIRRAAHEVNRPVEVFLEVDSR